VSKQAAQGEVNQLAAGVASLGAGFGRVALDHLARLHDVTPIDGEKSDSRGDRCP
jgi:hypothetical protein